jgi:hypothetical protein
MLKPQLKSASDPYTVVQQLGIDRVESRYRSDVVDRARMLSVAGTDGLSKKPCT